MFDPSVTNQKPKSMSSSIENKETESKKIGNINESGQNEKRKKKSCK